MQRENGLQEEYDHAVLEAKKLAEEYDETAPEHLKQRIKKAISYAADLLIMMETPKRKIAGKLLEDFDYFYSRATVYRILGSEFFEDDKSSQMRQKDSSLNRYEQENEEELAIFDELEDLIHIVKSALRTGPYASLLNPKERAEFNTLKRGLIAMAKDAFDGRQLVPTPTQPLLLHCAIDCTLQDTYANYLTVVKDHVKKLTADSKIRGIRTIQAITSKQMGRLLTLNVKEVHESLNPATPEEAQMKGFSGQRCPKCKDLRCNRLPDSSEGRWYKCLACEFEFQGIIIPAYVRGIALDESYSTYTAVVERAEGIGKL